MGSNVKGGIFLPSGGLGSGGCPVKLFETVPVIEGCTFGQVFPNTTHKMHET